MRLPARTAQEVLLAALRGEVPVHNLGSEAYREVSRGEQRAFLGEAMRSLGHSSAQQDHHHHQQPFDARSSPGQRDPSLPPPYAARSTGLYGVESGSSGDRMTILDRNA